jgi:hypothetical protein
MSEQPQQKKPSKALGYTALLLSIGGMGCFITPYVSMFAAALGVLAIVLELRAPERHAGGGAAMAAVVIGVGGAFAWYGMRPYISSRGELRSGSPGTESVAIGKLRSLASAETAYSSVAGGFYGTPECLQQPSKCTPALPADTVPFLDREFFSNTGAYVITFHPGPKSTETGFQTYAAVSVPRIPGETGRRAFCVDSTNTIRFTTDSSPPPVANGLCAESTPALR